MERQPVIYLCEYRHQRAAQLVDVQRHAVALERPPRPDTDEVDCLPDVLAELLGRAHGVDPDAITVTVAERVDVAGGVPHRAYLAPMLPGVEPGIGSVLLRGAGR